VAAALPERHFASQAFLVAVAVYRGVPRKSPAYREALRGIARPRGGTATPAEHNAGNTMSEYTSWTTERHVAECYAGPDGVVLRVNLSDYPGRWCETLDIFYEREVLIVGTVFAAEVVQK
jgi:hypothetical protein